MKIIKRYSNRKLYDTETHKYITLFELAKAIRSGTDVVIKDHVDERDITSQTLALAVAEAERQALLNVPQPLIASQLVAVLRLGVEQAASPAGQASAS